MASAVPATPQPAPTRPPAGSPPGGFPDARAATAAQTEPATQQPAELPDLNDGYDRVLFAPTDRPGEPITQGAPFGPGANWIPRPHEDDRSFLLRVASDLENTPGASGPLRAYIDKIRLGG